MMYTVYNQAHQPMVKDVTLEQARAWLDVMGLSSDYVTPANDPFTEVEI